MMDDHHLATAQSRRRRLSIVLAISAIVFVVELGAGIATNSLALIADAGHVATDAAAVALALVAVWLAERPAGGRQTFGWQRMEILAATANAILLLGIGIAVLWQAWQRFGAAPEIAVGPMIAAATLGLVANAAGLAILHRGHDQNMNMRAAYLEVVGDTLGAMGVIVAGAVIIVTGRTEADAIASVLIGFLIVPRTWLLLRQALDVLLEASPRGVDLGEVRRHILEAPGVLDLHDLHIWTITSGLNAVSAHVVIAEGADRGAVLDGLSKCLNEDFDVEHSTFQLEARDRRAREGASHA